ncbi:MAG: hypothetical protein ACM3N7_03970, partial [Planctomycetaceae bacterium]
MAEGNFPFSGHPQAPPGTPRHPNFSLPEFFHSFKEEGGLSGSYALDPKCCLGAGQLTWVLIYFITRKENPGGFNQGLKVGKTETGQELHASGHVPLSR